MSHRDHAVPRERAYLPVVGACDRKAHGWCWRCAMCHPVSRFAGLEGGTQKRKEGREQSPKSNDASLRN